VPEVTQHGINVQGCTQQSPEPWPRAFACSALVPSQGGWAQLCEKLARKQPDRFQIRRSLVVGRSCRRWHLGPGVHRDVPLGPGHLRRCSGRRVSPPGKTTPGTSVIRRKCWSRGRIVSALLSAAQGGCLPSMEPPNPVAVTMGPPSGASKGSSTSDTGLYRGQRGFVNGASPEVLRAIRC
jgi:hypothetical protein